jgi:RNA polymerase sigma factor (sigma-70 family)
MSLPLPDTIRWFTVEIQPHEPALRAYLHLKFPTLTDIDDLIHDAYIRLLRLTDTGKVRSPKAFLFATARNAALDCFRHKQAVSIDDVTHFDEISVLPEQTGVAETVCQQQELEILAEAVHALPDRCRQVIMLRYIDGLSYKEIAARLGIATETVKAQMAKGMRRCSEYFHERGMLESNAVTKKRILNRDQFCPTQSGQSGSHRGDGGSMVCSMG